MGRRANKETESQSESTIVKHCWALAHGRHLDLGQTGRIMGVVNVTPDSFSDGGRHAAPDDAIARALRLIGEGADIIDIGGESTRPGAEPVSAAEEQARILPVIEQLARRDDILLSVDTYRAETASLAVAAGAHIVNDVWGLQRDGAMASVAERTGAGIVIMHTGRERQKLPDVIADQFHFLGRALELAAAAGIARQQIVVDPGFGFAKDTNENLEIMARFGELHRFGLPILAGTSRKRFIGAVTGRDGDDRDWGTAATSALLRQAGAAILRVHEVPINLDAVRMADAVMAHAPDKDDRHE